MLIIMQNSMENPYVIIVLLGVFLEVLLELSQYNRF